MLWPPSQSRKPPVMCRASSLARKSTGGTMSDGCGILFSGVFARTCSRRPDFQSSRLISASVSTKPGPSVLTRTWGASARAYDFVHPDDRVLRGCVLWRARAALDDDAGSDVDDRAGLLIIEHAPPELVRHQHRPFDVDGERVVDRLRRQLTPGHLIRRHVADVVDEHVNAPEVRDDFRAHALHVVPRGNIGLEGRRFAAVRADAVGCRLSAGGRAAVVNGDVCALLGERLRDSSAEARPCAGDERDPALEVFHSSSSLA